MADGSWKARFDAILAGFDRDLARMGREVDHFLSVLDTTERLVLLGLAFIGLFYLLIRNFQRRSSDEEASGRFAGLLLVVLTFAVGLGWMFSADRMA
jgi:hypothetical protein